MSPKNKTIVFDLDGTITSKNTFPHLSYPNKKVVKYMKDLIDAEYEIEIFSARWNEKQNGKKQAKEQIKKVKEYLKKYDIPYTRLYESDKPRAKFYVDDKAINVKDIGELDKLLKSNLSGKFIVSSIPNPIRRNFDYDGMNWLERIKILNEKRKLRKEKLASIGVNSMIKLSKRDVGQIFIGPEGLDKSWQKKFPNNTPCCRCGGNARIGFVYKEFDQKKYVRDLHHNKEDDKYWPHDAVAVATYFCEKCLEPTSLYNQA